MFKKFGIVLTLVAALSFSVATVAPKRAEALVGFGANAPAAIITGAVIGGLATTASVALLAAGGWFVLYEVISVPFVVIGLIILPADSSSQYRFPELKTAPPGISAVELAAYHNDRPVLESLAQDVRATLASEMLTAAQWNVLTKAEKNQWAKNRAEQAAKLWTEYVEEGLISESSRKVLAAAVQE